MTRLILSLLLFFSSTYTYSAAKPENFGIALVHGTNDHREDAEKEYWKSDFVFLLASALPNPNNKFIVHCDFSQYMWTAAAAGCVVEQLLSFIEEKKITKLVVYTHSNGGNVIRWIVSNPTYDSSYLRLVKTIHQVVAIAPSSGGTVLADEAMAGNLLSTSLGWLMGYQTKAVRQQRIGDMAIYNDELLFGTEGRPPIPIPFRVVVGTDVISSPFSSVSYCNGYLLNTSLIITKAYLEQCADGFLNCKSQTLAGKVWFYDREKTFESTPLNHNQSRHSCLGFGDILRTDLQGITA